MVAHVEQGSDGPVVVAVETHSVTTKTPPSRRAKPPGGTESPAFHQRRGRPGISRAAASVDQGITGESPSPSG